jgi:hypothetical protein
MCLVVVDARFGGQEPELELRAADRVQIFATGIVMLVLCSVCMKCLMLRCDCEKCRIII